MASTLSTTTQQNPVGTSLLTFRQPFPGKGVALTTTAVFASTARIVAVMFDNLENSTASYLKIYTSAPTFGTTAPEVVLKARANSKIQYTFDPGIELSAGHAAFTVHPGKGLGPAVAPDGTCEAHILMGT